MSSRGYACTRKMEVAIQIAMAFIEERVSFEYLYEDNAHRFREKSPSSDFERVIDLLTSDE